MYLYKFMNNEGIPIYYGTTKNLEKRINTHKASTPFIDEVFNIHFTTFEKSSFALAAEIYFMNKHKTKYNVRDQKNKEFSNFRLDESLIDWICYKNKTPILQNQDQIIKDINKLHKNNLVISNIYKFIYFISLAIFTFLCICMLFMTYNFYQKIYITTCIICTIISMHYSYAEFANKSQS